MDKVIDRSMPRKLKSYQYKSDHDDLALIKLTNIYKAKR